MHQHAPKFKVLGMESSFFVFGSSEVWKVLFDKVQICVCKHPIDTKLPLIVHNEHLVLLCVLIESSHESDCKYLRGSFRGSIGTQFSPCIIHAMARIFHCLEKVSHGQGAARKVKSA